MQSSCMACIMDLDTSLFFSGDELQTCLNQYYLITSYFSKHTDYPEFSFSLLIFRAKYARVWYLFNFSGTRTKMFYYIWGQKRSFTSVHRLCVIVC